MNLVAELVGPQDKLEAVGLFARRHLHVAIAEDASGYALLGGHRLYLAQHQFGRLALYDACLLDDAFVGQDIALAVVERHNPEQRHHEQRARAVEHIFHRSLQGQEGQHHGQQHQQCRQPIEEVMELSFGNDSLAVHQVIIILTHTR